MSESYDSAYDSGYDAGYERGYERSTEDHEQDISNAETKIAKLVDALKVLAERPPINVDRAGFGECIYCGARNYSYNLQIGAHELTSVVHGSDCIWQNAVAIAQGVTAVSSET